MDSMLRFRLEKEAVYDEAIANIKEQGRDRRVRPLIILDHF